MSNVLLVAWRPPACRLASSTAGLGLRQWNLCMSGVCLGDRSKSTTSSRGTDRNKASRGLSTFQISWPSGLFEPRHTSPVPASPHSKGVQLARPFSSCSRRAHAAAQNRPRYGTLSETEYRKHPGKFRDLPASRLRKILGVPVSAEDGNRVLRTLQKQRITGTLDHEIKDPVASPVAIQRGLAWLRETYQVDEDAAIIRRIEEEEEMESDLLTQRAENLGLYRPLEKEDENQEREIEESQQRQTEVYGTSVLETVRKHNEAKWEEEEKRREAETKQREEQELVENQKLREKGVQPAAGKKVLSRRRESVEWVKKYREKARLSMLSEPPKMSKAQRLIPGAVLTVFVLVMCYTLAQSYTPPPPAARLFPDVPPAAATITTMIGLNAFVLVLWRVPHMWRFMNQYFLIIPATPRAFSLLGNFFSHHSPLHLASNMLVLWVLGTRLHDEIGRGNFVALYIACGTLASFGTLVRFVFANALTQSSLGASGAICGVISCYLLMNRGLGVSLAFLPDSWNPIFSSEVLLAIIVGAEVVLAFRGFHRVDHASHLAGFFGGALGCWLMNAEEKRKKASRELREKDQKIVMETT